MRLKNVWELLMLRVVLADRVMLLKTTLESILKQRHRLRLRSRGGDDEGVSANDPLPSLPPTLQSSDSLQQLAEEFFPVKYVDEARGSPQSASFDHNGYLRIPEG